MESNFVLHSLVIFIAFNILSKTFFPLILSFNSALSPSILKTILSRYLLLNNLEIKFYERTLHGKKLIFSIDKIPKSNLIQEIIKGANTLLRSLQKINHLDLEEYNKLENNLKSLRALYNKNKP